MRSCKLEQEFSIDADRYLRLVAANHVLILLLHDFDRIKLMKLASAGAAGEVIHAVGPAH